MRELLLDIVHELGQLAVNLHHLVLVLQLELLRSLAKAADERLVEVDLRLLLGINIFITLHIRQLFALEIMGAVLRLLIEFPDCLWDPMLLLELISLLLEAASDWLHTLFALQSNKL